ncbi:Toll/interleukin-1 receptor domain-containing protein, partial [Tanacetum coccineum]
IDALLSSIGERCTNLIYLSMQGCFSLNSTEVKLDGLKCLKEFVCSYSKGPEKIPFRLRLTCSLRKLDLSRCCYEDGEIQSDIGELSNLQHLDLSYNNFSKLHFSLSKLTRLKVLNLNHCGRLVKLPELPSSIAIIIADGCDKLTSIGDLNENCKWLCYISLYGSTVIDGNRLLQSMLKSMQLRIRGLEIPKQFTSRLYAGHKYHVDNRGSPEITIKEASDYMHGIGASLVPMNNGSGLTDTSTDSSEFTDDYTPKISIHYDSKSSLRIPPRVCGTNKDTIV